MLISSFLELWAHQLAYPCTCSSYTSNLHVFMLTLIQQYRMLKPKDQHCYWQLHFCTCTHLHLLSVVVLGPFHQWRTEWLSCLLRWACPGETSWQTICPETVGNRKNTECNILTLKEQSKGRYKKWSVKKEGSLIPCSLSWKLWPTMTTGAFS